MLGIELRTGDRPEPGRRHPRHFGLACAKHSRFGRTLSVRQTPSCLDFRTCYRLLRNHAIHLPPSYQGENGGHARQNVRSHSPRPFKRLTASDHSLESLASYIQSQRDLLSRTQSEIERLHALKRHVKSVEDPTVEDINQKVRLFARFFAGHTLDCRACSSPPAFLGWMRKLEWMWA
jgi:hypothetical protein